MSLQSLQNRSPRADSADFDFFKDYGIKAIERWATVHQGWKDLLRIQNEFTRTQSTAEVKKYKPEKGGFSEREVESTIDGLGKKGFITLST